MDPPLRESSSILKPKPRSQAQSHASVPDPSPISTELSSAKSRAKRKHKEPISQQVQDEIRPEDALGQFSYTPATQTTVVTTTTTTTTNFPPIMLKAPQHLQELDTKQYPLAASPTPHSIRKLHFEVEGTPTSFEEADDTLGTVQQLKEQTQALSQSHGALQSMTQLAPGSVCSATSHPELTTQAYQAGLQTPHLSIKRGTKRSASPVSIPDAASISSQPGSRKRRLGSGDKKSSQVTNLVPSSNGGPHSRLQIVQTSTPITPHVGHKLASTNDQPPAWALLTADDHGSSAEMSRSTSGTFGMTEDSLEDPQVLSPNSEDPRSSSFQDDRVVPDEDGLMGFEVGRDWQDLGIASAMAPRVDQDADAGSSSFLRPSQQHRSRPTTLDTALAQDASLPSPSLSPVTAAATLQNRRTFFEQSPQGLRSLNTSFKESTRGSQTTASNQLSFESSVESQNVAESELTEHKSASGDGLLTRCSMMNIPTMVQNFEAMPEEMKSYVIYQMLRRCSKTVLHFVADVVNPALKCDFLRLLPVELCLNILGNLDAKTLCSAAKVSRRWRHLVDSSEKVWKRLFDVDNYALQEGELPRAIREGWGWQFASGTSESEKDLRPLPGILADMEAPLPSRRGETLKSHLIRELNTPPSKRLPKPKAKAKSRHPNRKKQKRQQDYSAETASFDEESLLNIISTAEGPYAAARTAIIAVPNPHIGLTQLQNMHLFKSIYMRHHIIRKTWMQDEVAPRHLAFRAHQRHVVTCLQFDAEKILTGSDDANINVYDTQTGALRAKLEGHEGGVWALQYEGNVLVSGSTDRSVRVWDIERGVCTHTFQGHTSTVRCLQILMPTAVGKTLDGRSIMMPKQPLIMTGSRDSNLRVWKLPKPGDAPFHQAGPAPDEAAECPYFVRALTGHHHSVRAIAAHADTLVSGSYDSTVRVWRISTGETVFRLQGHSQKVYSVVLDHKRNRCISGSMDNVVKVWSLDSGTALFNLEGHSSLVGLLDLQQDHLVSAAADSTLRIWDPKNGQCKSTLSAHTGAITCFQHDGQKVISGSDRTLKMWNVSTGEFVKDLLTDLSGVWQVKFNERRCVAAVQRNNLTYIEVLDFGASRDGVPEKQRGRRIIVNSEGYEIFDPHDTSADADILVEE